ncbi:MAG: hypothetical protein WA885_07995 [Phormidesmis sp.]
MSYNAFFKTIVCLVTVPMMASAIATGIQKPAIASTAATPLTTAATQPLETPGPATAELISRYAAYSFRLINGQSRAIHYFYASPSNVDNWEEDILGRSTLSSNSYMQVTIDDDRGSCYYDFKAVFSDGSSATHYDIDVCELASYTF